jgi:hypothetical protein
MKKKREEIVTFKADASLVEAMKGISNRSEFIRNAILLSLDSTCPLCGGSGLLTPDQKTHWKNFLLDHSITECRKCHELHLVCSHRRGKAAGKVKHHLPSKD